MTKKTTTTTISAELIASIVAQVLAAQGVAVEQPKVVVAKTAKSQPKVVVAKATKEVSAKPTTKTAAIAAYKEAHNITEGTKALARAIKEANFAKDWAKWQASAAYKNSKGAERKALNQAKAKALYAAYDKKAGMVF